MEVYTHIDACIKDMDGCTDVSIHACMHASMHACIWAPPSGGDDGCMHAYTTSSREEWPTRVYTNQMCPGNAYGVLGTLIESISPSNCSLIWLQHFLALPGKVMALSALGEANSDLTAAVQAFFYTWDAPLAFSECAAYRSQLDAISALARSTVSMTASAGTPTAAGQPDQVGYNIAAAIQSAIENIATETLSELLKAHSASIDAVGLTGGCALNVRANQLVAQQAEAYGKAVHVPAAPNDAGIAIGAAFALTPPRRPTRLEHTGPPLFDLQHLSSWADKRHGQRLGGIPEVAALFADNRVVASVRGRTGASMHDALLGTKTGCASISHV